MTGDAKNRAPTKRPPSSLSRMKPTAPSKRVDSYGSDTESSESGDNEQLDGGGGGEDGSISNRNDTGGKQFSIDHKEWEKMNVSTEIKEMFQYILRYSKRKTIFF